MIRNSLLYLLLLKICLTNGQSDRSWSNIVRDSTFKLSGEKGNHTRTSTMVYYGPPGIPSFSNAIHIDDVEDTKEKFNIKEKLHNKEKLVLRYSNLTFYNMSNAYFLKYRIDLAKQKVDTYLTSVKGQLQGHLSVSTQTSANSSGPFVLNLDEIILSYEMSFQVTNETIIFGETVNQPPYFRTAIREIPEDMQNFESKKFTEAISAKLCEEVKQKTNLDNVRFQIKREIFNNYRAAFRERFQKTIDKAFQSRGFGSDVTNLFHLTDLKYLESHSGDVNISVRSFTLHSREYHYLHKNFGDISFIEDEVYLIGRFHLSSPRLSATIEYRNETGSKIETLVAEYQLNELAFIFHVVARLDTASIDLEKSFVEMDADDLRLADDQAKPNDIRSEVIMKVEKFLRRTSYIALNFDRTLRHYVNGVLANGAKEPGKSRSSIVQTILDEKANSRRTVTYYGPPGVPSFSDSINLPDGGGITDYGTTVHFSNISFYNLSNAYSLKYRIELQHAQIETHLGLSNVQIQGRTSFPPNDTSQGLLVNFDKMSLSYVTMFTVKNGTVILKEYIRACFSPDFGKATVKSETEKYVHKYLPPTLLKTIKDELCEEVQKKINPDDPRFQIQREINYMYRTAIGKRFKRTIVHAFRFELINSDIFNQLHFDTTNYRVSIMNRWFRIYSS